MRMFDTDMINRGKHTDKTGKNKTKINKYIWPVID